MITKLSDEKLVVLGTRYRVDYLCEQAGYTLGVAAAEGAPLEAMLPPGYLKEVSGVVAELNAARQDKTLMVEDSKGATRGQNDALRKAKLWRRRVVKRAGRAHEFGEDVPAALLRATKASTVPDVAAQLKDMTALLEANLAKMPGAGADKLLEEGKGLLANLESADAAQEAKRLSELPAKVKAFQAKKGALYVALKIINGAGQELHAHDVPASSRYNLAILYRRGNNGGGDGPTGD
jgi:hypothetical protein